MSNRAFNLLVVVSFLSCASVAGWAIHHERANGAARLQRQANIDAASAAVSAAVQRAEDFMVATHYRENVQGAAKLNADVQPLIAEQMRLLSVIRAVPRTQRPADVAARRKAQADFNAQQLFVAAGLRRVQDHMSTHPVDVRRLTQMNAETIRLMAVAKAAVAVSVIPSSTVGTWATVLAAMPPLAWAIRRQRLANRTRRRLRTHRCVACDYDLRASPDRCPECGAVASLAVPRPLPAALNDGRI